MAHPGQKEGLTVHAISIDQAKAALAGMDLEKVNTGSPNITLDDVLQDCECYEVRRDGQPVMHYALTRITRANGKTDGYILAAQGRCKGVDLTHAMLPYMEKQLSDCDWIELHTRRRPLAMKAGMHGYKVCGVKLGKMLK